MKALKRRRSRSSISLVASSWSRSCIASVSSRACSKQALDGGRKARICWAIDVPRWKQALYTSLRG
jgi:hypothetical protein